MEPLRASIYAAQRFRESISEKGRKTNGFGNKKTIAAGNGAG